MLEWNPVNTDSNLGGHDKVSVNYLPEIKFLFSFFSQLLDKDTQELNRKTEKVSD